MREITTTDENNFLKEILDIAQFDFLLFLHYQDAGKSSPKNSTGSNFGSLLKIVDIFSSHLISWVLISFEKYLTSNRWVDVRDFRDRGMLFSQKVLVVAYFLYFSMFSKTKPKTPSVRKTFFSKFLSNFPKAVFLKKKRKKAQINYLELILTIYFHCWEIIVQKWQHREILHQFERKKRYDKKVNSRYYLMLR